MVFPLHDNCDLFEAGNLANCLHTWKTITSDREILASVAGLTIVFSETPEQHPNHKTSFSDKEKQAITTEIDKLIEKRVIEPTGHDKGEIISPIFTRPKKDGSHRLILNLKQLNTFSPTVHFKMDTLSTVLKLVKRNCFMASVDLKDAYYAVRVARSHRKYLRFFWNDVLYQYTCMPNGLSCAPRKFTKLLKTPLSTLHRMGHIVVGYIDDLFLQGNTYDDCVNNVVATCKLLDSLGFYIHSQKSVFLPAQQIVFLGFVINSVTMTVTLTADKARDIQVLCRSLCNDAKPTVRATAKVIGKIIASLPGVMFGPLYFRAIEKHKTIALKRNRGNFDRCMALSAPAKRELDWWIDNILLCYNPITRPDPDCTLTTDACNEGWGAVYNDHSTGGFWSLDEKPNHINYLELLAVFLGIKTFLDNERGKHVRLMIDNSTAVLVINKMGTSHSYKLNSLCKTIWEWAIPRDLWLSAAHIPGKINTRADFESRENKSTHEWKLEPTELQQALNILRVKPIIYLFASRLNYQFEDYVSYRPDPGASAIDAFTISWSNLEFYAFPPFSVIPHVLQKIQEDQASGVLVMPNWPTQLWYPKALQMTTRQPVILKPHETLLTLPHQPKKLHPLWAKLKLLVCHLSGKILTA